MTVISPQSRAEAEEEPELLDGDLAQSRSSVSPCEEAVCVKKR